MPMARNYVAITLAIRLADKKTKLYDIYNKLKWKAGLWLWLAQSSVWNCSKRVKHLSHWLFNRMVQAGRDWQGCSQSKPSIQSSLREDQLQYSCALQTCLSTKKAVKRSRKTYIDCNSHPCLPVAFLMLTDIAFLQRIHEGNSFETVVLTEQQPWY